MARLLLSQTTIYNYLTVSPYGLKIINAEGDFVYRDAFILSSRSSRAPSWKMYAFTGLDVSFSIGEGILDFCYTDFTKEQDGILLLGVLFSNAKKREDIVRNQDEVLEAESNNMERTLSSLDKYLYQSVYSSIFT